MSLLDQAKHEATRLFKLAKTNPVNNIPHLPIPHLSAAKEHIAYINGFPNWHNFERNLKQKDNVCEDLRETRQSKLPAVERDYYIQDIPFIIYKKRDNQKGLFLYEKKEHIPIYLGQDKACGTIFKKHVPKKWLLNNYPVLISGGTGAGKPETLLSLASQYIDNNEGCIYVNGIGMSNIYNPLFSHTQKANRLDDLYFLNLNIDNRDTCKFFDSDGNNSQSFDPINPIIGAENLFIEFFGKDIGILINSIGSVAKAKNWLLDATSLKSITMLPNLIQWSQNNFWESATDSIQLYLNSIGYNPNDSTNYDDIIEEHYHNCKIVTEQIKLLQPYYDKGVFSITPQIDLYRIFKDRKILLINLNLFSCFNSEPSWLSNLIMSHLSHTGNLLNQEDDMVNSPHSNHWQNILVEDLVTVIRDSLTDYIFSGMKLPHNNWIFTTSDYYRSEQEFFKNVISSTNTFVIMKTEIAVSDLPDFIKILVLENLPNVPKIFSQGKRGQACDSAFSNQREGTAYVLAANYQDLPNSCLNSEKKWYFENIVCEYNVSRIKNDIYINKFHSHIHLEKS